MRTKEVRVGMECVFTPRRIDVPRIRARLYHRCVIVQAHPLRVRFEDGDEWGIHPRSITRAPNPRDLVEANE